MKRLVFLVEGDGDVLAVPSLAGRLLSELPVDLQGQLFPDPLPFRIGGLNSFTLVGTSCTRSTRAGCRSGSAG